MTMHRSRFEEPQPNPMVERTVRRQLRVTHPSGLHIRPAVALVKVAAGFESAVRFRHQDRVADGKSVMDLLTLGAGPGATVELEVIGSDAEEAAEAIARVWDELLGGGETSEDRGSVDAGSA